MLRIFLYDKVYKCMKLKSAIYATYLIDIIFFIHSKNNRCLNHNFQNYNTLIKKNNYFLIIFKFYYYV